MTEKPYEKIIVIDSNENADWILGPVDSEKRKKELEMIQSLKDQNHNLQELWRISLKSNTRKKKQ